MHFEPSRGLDTALYACFHVPSSTCVGYGVRACVRACVRDCAVDFYSCTPTKLWLFSPMS